MTSKRIESRTLVRVVRYRPCLTVAGVAGGVFAAVIEDIWLALFESRRDALQKD
jgi:hypothetical protein